MFSSPLVAPEALRPADRADGHQKTGAAAEDHRAAWSDEAGDKTALEVSESWPASREDARDRANTPTKSVWRGQLAHRVAHRHADGVQDACHPEQNERDDKGLRHAKQGQRQPVPADGDRDDTSRVPWRGDQREERGPEHCPGTRRGIEKAEPLRPTFKTVCAKTGSSPSVEASSVPKKSMSINCHKIRRSRRK